MATDVKTYCTAHNTSCVNCATDNCNTATPPNTSNIIGASLTTMFVLIFAIFIMY